MPLDLTCRFPRLITPPENLRPAPFPPLKAPTAPRRAAPPTHIPGFVRNACADVSNNRSNSCSLPYPRGAHTFPLPPPRRPREYLALFWGFLGLLPSPRPAPIDLARRLSPNHTSSGW